jgi:hypothetical protein
LKQIKPAGRRKKKYKLKKGVRKKLLILSVISIVVIAASIFYNSPSTEKKLETLTEPKVTGTIRVDKYSDLNATHLTHIATLLVKFGYHHFQVSTIRCVALENVGMLQKTFGVNDNGQNNQLAIAALFFTAAVFGNLAIFHLAFKIGVCQVE